MNSADGPMCLVKSAPAVVLMLKFFSWLSTQASAVKKKTARPLILTTEREQVLSDALHDLVAS